ncbi:twin-arginine translocase TatA/TatE family subunit [Candidatus Desulforudis audaxviator]|uniref:Sec-independent protein translocase protein TatA n=1 Tax=Desulforudis audaxviator (strain MP104C) TaxID=477974 RepID=B1I3Q2_DESAP|nr:twin-arginine translocase TatA/TatE family subunit [Candidatus Desulforudis audaxviator]ACA59630.1 twin-arginine translocation protein, TatA/E family subunit [Candidatus Desulforudis audaxviator MP104C]AZK59620.1 Twin-arginine translocation protein TatAd [Candidatus Desulforudis audaxviator]
MLPNIGIPELILILALALIVFGPGKLPEVGKSLGKTIREFRKSSRETFADVTDSIKEVKEDVYEAKRTLEVTKEEEAPKSAQS